MKKVVVSGMLGNALEWYDFAIYGQLAYILSTLFFPSENAVASLLATYSVFAVGFLFRPLGAIIFGWIGDTYGRRAALVIAILMMAIPTGLMGLVPTYAQIGILAPIILTALRVFQGLSLGGEFSGSIVYIVEHAPQNHRGIAGSASMVSLILGFLAGTLTVLAVKNAMSVEDFESYGWRIPFLLGVGVGVVGFYIRRKCHESPAYTAAKACGNISKTPLREALTKHWKPMLQGFGAYIGVTMPFYLIAIYMISFMKTEAEQTIGQAFTINTIAMTCMLFGMIAGAKLSDRFGRKRVMVVAISIMFALAIPLFLVMESKAFMDLLLAQSVFAFVLGTYIGPVPAFLVELFPTRVRFTGMALAYNTATSIFGGTAPMVCVWLTEHVASNLSIAWYVMFCSVCALISLVTYHDRWKEPLT